VQRSQSSLLILGSKEVLQEVYRRIREPDIALCWMIKNAKDLGLQLNQGFLDEYLSVDGLFSLDTIDDPWSPKWLFPKRRTVPDDASVSNSVQIRCGYDTSYQPGNLKRPGGTLAGTYKIAPVVTPAPEMGETANYCNQYNSFLAQIRSMSLNENAEVKSLSNRK
jgi:hypothetical protein